MSVTKSLLFANNRWFVKIAYGFIASLGMFLVTWERGDIFVDNFLSRLHGRNEDFDFIVVGSGAGGSVVASRLTENPHWNVLLIEAGGEPAPFHSIPCLAFYLNNYQSTDWHHVTVSQKDVGGFSNNEQFVWSQGKSLGGSSNIHHMIWARGSAGDYNNWANITGDSSWNFDNVLPYFKRSEDYHGGWINEDLHGRDGPINIEIPDYHPMSEYFVQAAQELGYNQVDLNGNYNVDGVDEIHYGSKRGTRHDVYKAFIKGARRRKNLTIYKFSHVTKILIDENNEAFGVEYDRHGKTKRAFARNEIILSAGAVQTPKLLMLSGIGPKEHLENLGISLKVDLPVGSNLQDHLGSLLGPFTIEEPKSFLADRDVTPSAFLRYLTHGQGVPSTAGTQAIGVFSSSLADQQDNNNKWPDILTLFAPIGIHRTFGTDLARSFGLLEEKLSDYVLPSQNKDAFWFLISVGRPKSTGHVQLASADPYDEVLINPQYYQHPDDIKKIVEALKLHVRLAEETETFKKLGSRLAGNHLPGCQNETFASDTYWECYARQLAVSLNHFTGTAAMGEGSSKEAVVDPKLRVRGTKRLRVVDASVIPQIPVVNIHATVIMIGEKAADLIKEYWALKTPAYRSKISSSIFS